MSMIHPGLLSILISLSNIFEKDKNDRVNGRFIYRFEGNFNMRMLRHEILLSITEMQGNILNFIVHWTWTLGHYSLHFDS